VRIVCDAGFVTQPNPRTLAAEELILSHFSLAPMHPIEDRVRLAAANGFAGIGLYVGQFLELEKEGLGGDYLSELLDRYSVCLAEIEVIGGLGVDGNGGEKAANFEAAAWRMADRFGCRYLQVIGPAGERLRAATAFASLCDRASDHGLVLGLEFLPFNDVVSAADALRIVEDAGRPNGGVCIDIWHHERGARDLDMLRSIPGDLITGVQMNDGPILPEIDDYYTDCLANRRAPGDGEFDIEAVVEILRASGCSIPWSVEAPSRLGWADPEAHVARLATGMRKFLA
jgi:sugar phosphate isomerase/epimerase